MSITAHMAGVLEYVGQQLRTGRFTLSAVEVYEERDGAGVFVILRRSFGEVMVSETLPLWTLERESRWKVQLEEMHRTLHSLRGGR